MAEQPFLAPVRGCSHEQSPRRVLREQTTDLVEARRGRSQPVGLVEDDQVPAGAVGANGFLDRGIDRGELERHDPEVVAADSLLTNGVCGEVAQAAAEEATEVGDPFRGEVRGADDDCPVDQAEALHLAQVQPGHDRFPGSRFVRQ
jgi:hypothetical protein